jgi:hypothetical protein
MSSNLSVNVDKNTNEVTVTDNGFTFTIAMDAGMMPDVQVDSGGEPVTLDQALEAAGARYDHDLTYKSGNRILGNANRA